MSDIIMHICPKCAWFKGRRRCDFCNEEMLQTDTILADAMKMTDKEKDELINYYIETLIKDTYDPKAREYREANERPVFAGYVHNSLPKCPYCKSTNTKKISGTSKVLHGLFFGVYSIGRNSKEWHCNTCNSDF